MSHLNVSQLSNNEIFRIRYARWKARTDLLYLCNVILGYPDVNVAVHQPILDILQHFPMPKMEEFDKHERLESGNWVYKPVTPQYDLPGGRRVLIVDPRGFLKTTINAQSHAIQWILNYPDIAMTIFQSTNPKAVAILREVKQHFQANNKFRQLFPDYVPQKRIFDWGTQEDFTIPLRGRPRREPTLMTASIEKGLAGYHFDVMKFSDIVDEENSRTDAGLNLVIERFGHAENLVVRPDSWIDVEGTRYSFSDLYGKIIDQEMARPPEKRRWKIHIRGAYVKKHPEGKPLTNTPEELDYEEARDANNRPISVWPSRWSVEALEAYREEHGDMLFACTPGWAPILMADWSDKPIASVEIGDEVIGWRRDGAYARLCKSRVVNKGGHEAEVYCVTTDQGHQVYCTADHLWWNGRKESPNDTHSEWQTVKIGRKLVRVVKPLAEADDVDPDFYWLCGMIDGEGAVKHDGLQIHQDEIANPGVSARLEQTLDKLKIPYKKHRRNDKPSALCFSIHGGRNLYRALLHIGKLGKSDQLLQKLWDHAARVGDRNGLPCKERIVSITPIGKYPVYWLTTETGNYVSQGFASKNCHKLNNPVAVKDVSKIPFPVNKEFPKIISPANFVKNVRVANHVLTVDTAETQNDRSDFSAITDVAWDGSGRPYVVDIKHGKYLPDELCAQIIFMYLKYKPTQVKIEETSYVRGLMPTLKRFMDTRGIYMPIEFIKRDTQIAKKERILNTLQPVYKSGELRFVVQKDGEPAKVGIEPGVYRHLLRELTRFPTYIHDDILDTLADQFQGKEWFGRLQARPTFQQAQSDEFERWLGITAYEDWAPASDGSPFPSHYNKTGGL